MRKQPLVIHIAPRVTFGGGIETMLEYYRELPFAQKFVALFDRRPSERSDYINLNFNWRTPLAVMRRRFAEALAPYTGATVVWHNGWGMPLFADRDGAARRLVFLYADPAYHAPDFPGFRGRVDGVAGVVPALQAAWRGALPELGAEREKMIGIPIELRPLAEKTFARKPFVLGYAGRVERAQKRVDRLPVLIAALERRGVDFRFEVLGDGSWRSRLAQQLGDRVKFHGWLPRADYCRVMDGWDGVVYFSDHEGGPTALLDAMAAGAIPFYPSHGGSWGDVHAPRVDPLCYYPAGDIEAAADAIVKIFMRPAAELQSLSARSRQFVLPHGADDHVRGVAQFIEQIERMPAIGCTSPRSAKITDLAPLGFVTRFAPGWVRR